MVDLEAPDVDVSRTATLTHTRKALKRNIVQILSQNALGLKSDDRINEITLMLHKRNIFICCIQENLENRGQRILTVIMDINFCYLAKKFKQNNRGSLGVGIILSPNAHNAWKAAGCEIHRFSARIIAVRLTMVDIDNRDIGLFVVSAYAPVGVAPETEWDNFFNDLDACISKKLPNDIIIIGSDTNSSIGCLNKTIDYYNNSCVGQFGLSYANDAGHRFASHLSLNELLAVTTCFRKNNYATWIHPRSKLKHQIDHFIVKKEHFRYVMDAGVSQNAIDSDHSAIVCKLRMISRLKKKTSLRDRLIRLDYSGLKSDVTSQHFCASVMENYNIQPPSNSPYTRLSDSVKATSSTLPQKKKPSPGWFTAAEDSLIPLIERRNIAMLKHLSRPLRSTAEKLKQARKALKRTVGKAKGLKCFGKISNNSVLVYVKQKLVLYHQ
ncbi:craniofacial development protein 2-like [Clytia hemisphaerica]|uniref:craniofacial development protein 2-like n=1 Tax=Clytia hemisphaerica TaxID=252671 RepID=UPI0034D57126